MSQMFHCEDFTLCVTPFIFPTLSIADIAHRDPGWEDTLKFTADPGVT